MKKAILNLNGVNALAKSEQKSVNGGITEGMAQCLANGCVWSRVEPFIDWVNSCGSKFIWCPPMME